MFIEPNFRGERKGWIEVICGSMFSGKTEELIQEVEKSGNCSTLKRKFLSLSVDVRYDEVKIVSHDENKIQSTPVGNSQTILCWPMM